MSDSLKAKGRMNAPLSLVLCADQASTPIRVNTARESASPRTALRTARRASAPARVGAWLAPRRAPLLSKLLVSSLLVSRSCTPGVIKSFLYVRLRAERAELAAAVHADGLALVSERSSRRYNLAALAAAVHADRLAVVVQVVVHRGCDVILVRAPRILRQEKCPPSYVNLAEILLSSTVISAYLARAIADARGSDRVVFVEYL